ncbi:hypothetical protein AZI86_12235 [Bdellovibrio bacteriovorus]|uniref:Cytochrome c domain-containing protein n=1 Tax=Bdellovibrio bacteriovorus TaxID=959 RepID=A0A150WMC8_BDEBC|nr:hypothetical protein [Bdellovibrio bacteriovorus]KYG64957.1 hypothetical protein AZI86_12235 [Bdellovibrio bacteriovorus]
MLRWILLAGLGLAQPALAKEDFLRYLRSITNDGKIISNGLFSESAPGVAELQKNLAHFKSDADVLSFLVSYPELKENFILVHRSESQQLSSLAHPRIILFGGGNAYAFSESPEQKNRRVEILTTDPKTYQVSLHEITFEKKGARLESNPKSCLTCHGSPSRALWNPYDFWPNTYGSAVGTLGTKQEHQAFANLKQNAPRSPLLSKLHLPDDFTPGKEEVTAFTLYISGLNQGRWITHHLKKGSGFDKIAKPFLAVIGQCIGESNYFDAKPSLEKMKKYIQVSSQDLARLDQFMKDQAEARSHFKNFLDKQLFTIFPEQEFLFKVDHDRLSFESQWLAYMRWILSLGGIDSRDLSSSLFGNDTLITSPGLYTAEFAAALYELRPDIFEGINIKVQNFSPNRSVLWLDCDSLQASIEKQAAPSLLESDFISFREDTSSRPLLSRCSKCHSEGLGNTVFEAPFIPFNDPWMLAQILRSPGARLRQNIERRIYSHGSDQMPPSGHITSEEKEALLSFIDNLL